MPVDTTHAEYFEPVLPPEVLLRGTKERTTVCCKGARRAGKTPPPLLAEARVRMKPQSPRKPSMKHMAAILRAFKA